MICEQSDRWSILFEYLRLIIEYVYMACYWANLWTHSIRTLSWICSLIYSISKLRHGIKLLLMEGGLQVRVHHENPMPAYIFFVKCIGNLETPRKNKKTVTIQTSRYLTKPSNWQTSTWPSWWSFLQMLAYVRFVAQLMENWGKTQSDSRHLLPCLKNQQRRICLAKPHYLWPKSLH